MTERKDNTIISILEKSNEKRTQEEVEMLVVLIKNIEFFRERNIREKYYPEIVSCLKLQRYRYHQFVFHKGDEGKHFFIILKGTVSVCLPHREKKEKVKKFRLEAEEFLKFKPKKDQQAARRRKNTAGEEITDSEAGEGEDDSMCLEDEDANAVLSDLRKSNSQEKFNKKLSLKHKSTIQTQNKEELTHGKSRVGLEENYDQMNPVEKLEFWENEPDLIEIAVLEPGASFGEIALIEDKPRGATIRCNKECIFATMEREDYTKTLSRIENRNINKIIDFFKDLPYFSSYGRAALNKIRFQFSRIK